MAETQAQSERQGEGAFGAYVKNVRDTAKSFWEGMSVTLSYMFRKPITSQYPDRMSVPVSETIPARDRKSTRLNSSHGYISYAVFCLKKKKQHTTITTSLREVHYVL